MDNRFEPDSVIDEWLEAAKRGDIAYVVDRLNHGMDVNTGNTINTTALMMAVRRGHLELVRILLDHGADLNAENDLGYTAMTYAVILSRPEEYRWTAPQLDARVLQRLLEAGGRYSLREAVLLNDVELARTRLDEGCLLYTSRCV